MGVYVPMSEHNSIQVSDQLLAGFFLISHHLSHYGLHQQGMFRNLDQVLTCHSILASIRVVRVAYPGFSKPVVTFYLILVTEARIRCLHVQPPKLILQMQTKE